MKRLLIESREFAYGNRREQVFYYFTILLIFLLSLLFLFPFYWMFKGALQPSYMANQIPPSFLPLNLTINNFTRLFSRYPAVRWFSNSTIVSGAATAVTLVFGSLAGYAFAKRHFPGKEILFWMLLTTMMLPRETMLIPLYILMNRYGLYNTYAGMALPQIAWPFGLFLMRQFMSSIPDELIQSAKIDGANEFSLFLRIIVPLSVPAFGTVGILYFVRVWNDYLWQLVITKDLNMNTLPVGVAKISQGEFAVDYGLLMSGAAISAIPMIIIFIFFQQYFVKGLTVGSVKG
jgi:multiple sugar transport system permease protein